MKVIIIDRLAKEIPILEKLFITTFSDVTFTYLMIADLDKERSAKKLAGCDLIVVNRLTENGEESDKGVVCTLRNLSGKVPIFLVANASHTSKYREAILDAGADGCVQSPFSPEEFALRFKKLLDKKDKLLFSGTEIHAKDVIMNIRSHTVSKLGKKIHLTKTEYSIFFHLLLRRNNPSSNQDLVKCLEGEIKDGSPAVNLHVYNLRKKLGDYSIIKTLPHYGFALSEA